MEQKSLILTCSECGYTESGAQSRALMLKVRMLNHVTRRHPGLAERFKDVVDAREKELSR